MLSSDEIAAIERQRLFEKAWLDWRESLTQEDVEGDPRELVSAAFRVAWGEGFAASQARERALADALEWYATTGAESSVLLLDDSGAIARAALAGAGEDAR